MAVLAKTLHAKFPSASFADDSSAANIANYTVDVVRTVKDFPRLASEWSELLKASGDKNISLDHTWLNLWLEAFPPDALFTLLVRDADGQLIAVAPFLISRNKSGIFCRFLRRMQFIGTSPEVYDWMKIIIHPEVNADLVLRLVADEILQNRALWDVLDLRYMISESQLKALYLRLRPFVKHSQISEPMSVPFIELPEELGSPPTYRKKKYQSDLNRIQNHLRNDFGEPLPKLRVHIPGPESDKILEIFLTSHQQYWLSRGCRTEYDRHRMLMSFYQSIYRHFSKNMADTTEDKPVFEFSTLEIGSNPVSYHFDIQTSQGCMGYLSCYNQHAKKYRPGHLHIEALIERTHQLGGRRFEFGRGDESYKNQWHIQKKPLWNLLAFRNSFSHFLWQMDTRIKSISQKRKIPQ